jgi:O-antigen ligase
MLRNSISGFSFPVLLVLSMLSACLVILKPLIGLLLILTALSWFLVNQARVRPLFSLLCFLIPLSFDAEILPGVNVAFPAEPLAVLMAFILFILLPGNDDFFSFFHRPLFIGVIAYLLPMLFACYFSVDRSVSMKFVFIQILYILVFFVLPFLLFQRHILKPEKLVYFLMAGTGLAVLYSFWRLATYGFNLQSAPAIARPFFKDHTMFSASLSLMLPLGIWTAMRLKDQGRKIAWAWVILVLLGIVFSTCRAAWISILLCLPFMGMVYVGLRFRHLPVLILLLASMVYFNLPAIENYVLSNRNDSNRSGSTISEQALSVTNVTNDVSNLERINRWKCAWRMSKDRPWTGFGPGTYQFQYFPYQLASETTPISLHSPFFPKEGRGGSAHSEYFLSLSESGWPGVYGWALLILSFLFTFFRVVKRNPSESQRNMALFCGIGICTYLLHAAFNNFLNAVNFAGFFWLSLSILMYLDLPQHGTSSVRKIES